MLILIIIAALLIIAIETPSLIRQRKWKELSLFSGFFISAIVLGGLLLSHLAFSNTGTFVESVFKPAAKLLMP